MKKRGQEELALFAVYIIIAIFVSVALMIFVSGVAGGRLVKSQVLAKEIALFIDAAKPDTSIEMEHENALVNLNTETKEVTVQIEKNYYTYDYFSSYSIDLESNGTVTKISIK